MVNKHLFKPSPAGVAVLNLYRFLWVISLSLLLFMSGCSGAAKETTSNLRFISVNVTGLMGAGLVLQNNQSDNLSIEQNGTFRFAIALAGSDSYHVSVLTHPSKPNQTCSVANNKGTVAEANDINVVCTTNNYTVGGKVSGLVGTLVLEINGTAQLNTSANGDFTFSLSLKDNSEYNVIAVAQPVLQTCTVTNGSGKLNGADISDLSVRCVDKQWTLPRDVADFISVKGKAVFAHTMAIDKSGNIVIVWMQQDGTSNCAGPCWQIFISEYRNGQWKHPAGSTDYISFSGQNASSPKVAMDDIGNTIVVWSQTDGTTDCANMSCSRIYKAEYRNNAWKLPSNLQDSISPAARVSSGGNVAMDELGNAIILWTHLDNTTACGGAACSRVYIAEYRNNTWKLPQGLNDYISPDGGAAFSAVIAMRNGRAVIAWEQGDGTTACGGIRCIQIYKSEYRNAQWRHPTGAADHISAAGMHANSAQIALDKNGNSILLWSPYLTGTDCGGFTCTQLYMSEYRGQGWNTPTKINVATSAVNETASAGNVAMDDNGNAIIIWSQTDGGPLGNGLADRRRQLYRGEYRNGAWIFPSMLGNNISPDGTDVSSPQVAMDNNGNAVIAWVQADDSMDCNGSTCEQVFKVEYRNGIWSNALYRSNNISPAGSHAGGSTVAMGDRGNAIITWRQADPTTTCIPFGCNEVFVSHFK